MNNLLDGLLVMVVVLDFIALGNSRMRAVVRATAAQGVVLAVVPLVAHPQVDVHLALVAAGTLLVKGLVIPVLLMRAIRDVTIRREIQPLIGFTPALLLGAAGIGLAFLFSDSLPLLPEHAGSRVPPAAFATVFAGFLILTTRVQAVMQVVGFLILENGIYLFGLLLLDAMPFLVEVGVLLDVLVGVFVIGIILRRIQRTFSSLDTTRLSALKD
jgi:hydrogenase-4 component E